MRNILTEEASGKQNGMFWLLAFFLLFLPSVPKASVLCIAVMVLLWLTSGDYKTSIKVFRKDWNVIFFSLFYIMHVIGLFYSSNHSFAYADLQTKLSFLLFPFMLSAYTISEEELKKLKRMFIAGNLLAVIGCIVFSVLNYSEAHSADVFFYIKYSHFLHPSYFSFYLTLAIIFLLDEVIRGWNKNSVRNKVLQIILVYVLFAMILQLSSRTASVAAYIAVTISLLLKIKPEFRRWKMYVLVLIFIVSVFSLQQVTLHYYNRFAQVEEAIGEKQTNTLSENEDNSTNLHVRIWKNSLDLIKRNIVFGVGTGDVKDKLAEMYHENNFKPGEEGHFNSHNQFLNTGVALGIAGLITLLLLFILPFVIAFKSRDDVYFIFLLIVFLNCMTESIFERQSGVLFFSVFNMLFYLRATSSRNNA